MLDELSIMIVNYVKQGFKVFKTRYVRISSLPFGAIFEGVKLNSNNGIITLWSSGMS